jgi:hypothetical protein
MKWGWRIILVHDSWRDGFLPILIIDPNLYGDQSIDNQKCTKDRVILWEMKIAAQREVHQRWWCRFRSKLVPRSQKWALTYSNRISGPETNSTFFEYLNNSCSDQIRCEDLALPIICRDFLSLIFKKTGNESHVHPNNFQGSCSFLFFEFFELNTNRNSEFPKIDYVLYVDRVFIWVECISDRRATFRSHIWKGGRIPIRGESTSLSNREDALLHFKRLTIVAANYPITNLWIGSALRDEITELD